MYRVGPLARLNVCATMGVPTADTALAEYRERAGGVANSSFFYHYARLIEILAATEHMAGLLGDPGITDAEVRATAGINRFHAVGASEAPRGTLSHWVVIEDGVIANYQAVVPTTWNASPRDEADVPGPYEASLLGNPVADVEKPLELLRTVHSFDPCMACACHTLDVEGNVKATVQVL